MFLLVASAVLGCSLQLVFAPGGPEMTTLVNDTTLPSTDQQETFSIEGTTEACLLPVMEKERQHSVDDPNSVKITPPGNITQLLGSLLNLTCNAADSISAPCYSWFFNHTNVNVTSSNLIINLTSWGNEGVYKCCVYNSGTNITYWASVTVRITTVTESSILLLLLGKVIAGIVIALVVGITLIVTLQCYFCARARSEDPPPPPRSIPSLYVEFPPGQLAGCSTKPENPDNSSTTYQELQYGDEPLYQELEK